MEQQNDTTNNRSLAKQILSLLETKKAQDIVAIDIAERSSFADYLIIASAGSERQLGTLSAEIADKMAEIGLSPKNIEGRKPSGWILMDYGDLVINLFSAEQRDRYNLEKIWSDGTFLSAGDL